MTTELFTWLLTYALHSTLLLALAWLVTRRLVQAHNVRELIWKTALVGGLISATVQTFSGIEPLSGRLSIAPAAATSTRVESDSATAPSTRVSEKTRGFSDGHPEGMKTSSPVVPDVAEALATPPAAFRFSFGRPSALMVGAWALVAVLLALHFLAAQVFLLVRVGRRALVRDAQLVELVDLLREEAGIRRAIRLTRAEGLPSPVALGLSEICIPDAALTELDREQQESMLAHELAHLARRDPLWLFGACLVERLLFFQPLNRVARRNIQEAAEYLCDDWSVRRSGSGITLAKCLVKVAEWIDARPNVPVSGMAEMKSHFVARIQRLIANHALTARPTRRWLVPAAVAAVGLLVVAAPSVTAARKLAVFGDPTPSSPDETPTTQASSDDNRAEPEVSGHDSAVVAALINALKDSDADVRRAAAHSLGSRKDPRAVPGLIGALADTDIEVRRSVVEALAEAHDSRAVDGLIGALKDEDAEVRAHAAQGLGEVRDSRAASALSGMLGDPSAGVRRNAIRALTEMKGARPVEPLIGALKDSDADVRQVAAQALGNLEDRRAVRPLIATIADPSANVRQATAQALGELKDAQAAEALANALKDADADVRQAAAQALGELELKSAPSALIDALRDSKANVRHAAAGALGEIHDSLAVPALRALLGDPDPDVRESAVQALGEVRDASAIEALAAALKSKDPNVRKRAAEALGERN